MKTLLALILGCLILACRSGAGPGPVGVPPAPDSSDPGSEDRIHLGLGQSAPAGDDGSRIVFAAVPEDSRCPAHVLCPWAGNGRVLLQLIDPAGGVTPISLNTTVEPRWTVVRNLRIELRGLLPYPQDPGPIPERDYAIELSVVER